MNITWDADRYATNFSFVPSYGTALLDLIDWREGLRVLDLGCGTGALSAEMAARGADVTGLDASPDMLATARANHPDLSLIEADATNFSLADPVDVVFSNAMMHWVDAALQPAMLSCIERALVPGGRLVCELGGRGCAGRIHAALRRAFERRGLAYVTPFFFPSVGEYAPMVEAAGLTVRTALLFDRPTRLEGEDGLADWINLFQRAQLEGLAQPVRTEVVREAVTELEPELRHDGAWWADYVRLRLVAEKPARPQGRHA